MKKRLYSSSLVVLALICGCSNNNKTSSPDNSSLPAFTQNSEGVTYVRAKAEFDVTSSPSGSAKYELVKKSYASSNCVNNICTDVSDVSVTNKALTQFSLIAAQSGSSVLKSASNALVSLIDLQVGTLFDNDLYSCGGTKCLAGAIRVYTTDNGGQIAGSGLYNSVTTQSVPLMISGGTLSSPSNIPYNPSDSSLIVDQEPIVTGQEIISLANGNFPNSVSPGYQINADFSQAGFGNYSAHVVVEYDLIGGPALPPDVYIVGYDSHRLGAYWVNGVKTSIPDSTFLYAISVSGSDIYLAGYDSSFNAATWKNGIKTNLAGGGAVLSTFLSGSTLYATGFDGSSNAVEWVVNWDSNGAVTTNVSTQLDSGGYGASIFVSNGIVYVSGADPFSRPTLWTNGVETYLSQNTGSAYSVAVSGTAVYVAGTLSLGSVSEATIWENGTATQLPSNGSSQAVSIFINGSNVHVTGSDNNTPVVWTGTVGSTTFVESAPLDQMFSINIGIAVTSDNADIYVVGSDSTQKACYWKNGTKFILDSSGGSAEAVIIVNH